MIVRIIGKLIERRKQSIIVDVNGLCYEIIVPASVLARVEETKDGDGNIRLVTYHYFQMSPSSGAPLLIGFITEVERDFFQQFIKVSGIGPRAAIKALDRPISEITRAIDEGDVKYLTTLPGIGTQRAKEVVAKLQGKVGRFGLIQDKRQATAASPAAPRWQEEALDVLLQLQYNRQEAGRMIQKALARDGGIASTEELLNEIYKQKVKS